MVDAEPKDGMFDILKGAKRISTPAPLSTRSKLRRSWLIFACPFNADWLPQSSACDFVESLFFRQHHFGSPRWLIFPPSPDMGQI
jgi:hypothetical protein